MGTYEKSHKFEEPSQTLCRDIPTFSVRTGQEPNLYLQSSKTLLSVRMTQYALYQSTVCTSKEELFVYKGFFSMQGQNNKTSSLHKKILEKLHSGHHCIAKCYKRARQSVWWPGIRTGTKVGKQSSNIRQQKQTKVQMCFY